MPEFYLRIWAEQTLFDCHDYRVEASTLEEAVKLLKDQQEEADWHSKCVAHPAITARESFEIDEVRPLDPEEIVAGDQGIALIDADGTRVRDLESVPTGCVQLGEPLELEETEAGDAEHP